jgi:hypothetical protein
LRVPGKLSLAPLFSNQLVAWKKDDSDQLSKVGMILDVLLMGQRFITCPKEWCGGDETKFMQTQDGYDAGLIFYEKIVMNYGGDTDKPKWPGKPPPVVFLTVLLDTTPEIESRLGELQRKWAEIHQVEEKQARVHWINKWDPNPGERIVTLISDWNDCE